MLIKEIVTINDANIAKIQESLNDTVDKRNCNNQRLHISNNSRSLLVDSGFGFYEVLKMGVSQVGFI